MKLSGKRGSGRPESGGVGAALKHLGEEDTAGLFEVSPGFDDPLRQEVVAAEVSQTCPRGLRPQSLQ